MEWFLEGLGPDLRCEVEDKFPIDLEATKATTLTIEERLTRVKKAKSLSFIMLKEEEELTSPKSQAILKRMEDEIAFLKEKI